MTELSYENLLLVCLVGALVPLTLGLLPRVRLPSVVLEITAGVLLGPAVLGWVRADAPVAVLGWLGLTFLLFLAGLEVDPAHLKSSLVRTAGLGYLITLLLATPVTLILFAAGWIEDPALLVVILSATAIGLVVPVIRDAGQVSTPLGQSVIVASTVADVTSIVLLSVLFGTHGSTASRTALLLTYGVVIAGMTVVVATAGRLPRLQRVLVALQDSTAQIRIRLAVVLLVALTALAARFGLETILGAFVAGVVLSLLDRRTGEHPQFRPKLDALGFGLLIPVFYVTTGLNLDLPGLLADSSALLRVPVLLLALLAVRGVPALLFVRSIGMRRSIAAGFLQATSLPFIVAASQVGVAVGLLSPVSAAALITTGILSVAIFPTVAFALLREARASQPPGQG
ncbi:cation:proton antiporter [Paractinoplanes hotanensis]|uniref:Cation:proton antiporter n=1 Tax=Paractinoplanes hotanensis TaxID=2906497 RepID=A0ABT0Y918_9ACTN|nr:cation:proton antiporter [Actinoplanes hotanensis]MCM4082320.1 cation:proton antiporter [Actinoplanes hotanensis]